MLVLNNEQLTSGKSSLAGALFRPIAIIRKTKTKAAIPYGGLQMEDKERRLTYSSKSTRPYFTGTPHD